MLLTDDAPFEALGPLGHGATGVVFRARARTAIEAVRAGDVVALKLLRPGLCTSESARTRFAREGRLGQSLEHGNVARCLAAGEIETDEGPTMFLAMELVEGQSLLALREALGAVPEQLCLHIALEAARGLDAIHRAGLVHRDIKPANIRITRDDRVKILDLGLARLKEAALRLTETGIVPGTPAYAAPERWRGAEADPASDLYSLGATLFELLSGRAFIPPPPGQRPEFEAPPISPPGAPTETYTGPLPEASPFTKALIRAMLDPDPAERPSSASALVSILQDREASAFWRHRAEAVDGTAARSPERMLTAAASTVPFVGRKDLLAALDTHADDAGVGKGTSLLVEGPRGVGKTRLLAEWMARRRARHANTTFLWGRWLRRGGGSAVSGMIDALRRWERERAGTAAFADVLPEPVELAETLERAVAAPGGQSTSAVPDETTFRTAFLRFLQRLSEDGSVVCLVEDLPLETPDVFTAIGELALGLRNHPVLLVATCVPSTNPQLREDLFREDDIGLLSLELLSTEDAFALLKPLIDEGRISWQHARQLSEEVEGSPYVLSELYLTLRQVGGEDGPSADPPSLSTLVPRSLEATCASRLDSLGSEQLMQLEVLAHLPHDATLEALVEVLSRLGASVSPLGLSRSLAQLHRQRGFPAPTDRGFDMQDAILRDYVERRTAPATRRLICGAVADVLAEREGRREAVAIAFNAIAAGNYATALEWTEPALHDLAVRFEHGRTAELLDELLGCEEAKAHAQRGAWLCELALAWDRCGVATRHIEDLRAAHEELGAAAEARSRVAQSLYMALVASGVPAEARLLLEGELARSIEDDHPDAQARTHLALGMQDIRERRMESALEHLTAAERLGEACADPTVSLRAQGNLAMLAHEGFPGLDHVNPLESIERMVEGLRAAGSPPLLLNALSSQAYLLGMEGRAGEALQCLSELSDRARRRGDRRMETFARSNMAVWELHLGDVSRAHAHAAATKRIAGEIGDVHLVRTCDLNLVVCEMMLGDLDTAKERLAAMPDVEETPADVVLRTATLYFRARCATLGRQPAEAEAGYRAVIASQDEGEFSGLAHLALAAADLEQDRDQAMRHWEAATTIAEKAKLPGLSVRCLAFGARVDPARVGDAETAQRRLIHRVSAFDATYANWDLWIASKDADALLRARTALHQILRSMDAERRRRALRLDPVWWAIEEASADA